MRSGVSSTIFLCFMVFQLANPVRGALAGWGIKDAASASKTTIEASESARSGGQTTRSAEQLLYWTPPPTNPKVFEELKQQSHIFTSSKGASSSKTSMLNIKKLFGGKNENALLDPLSEEDKLLQAFIAQMLRSDTPAEYQDHLIQLGFKKLLEKPDFSAAEAEVWLNVLQKALNQARSQAQPFAHEASATSVLYGLYSLHLRYQGIDFLPPEARSILDKTNQMIANIKKEYFGIEGENEHTASSWIWQKEILNPSKGFSDQLANEGSLGKVTEKDDRLAKAMSHRIEKQKEAFEVFQKNFRYYSAHKRVTILAILHHHMSASSTLTEQPRAVLDGLKELLPHEVKLLQKVKEAPKTRALRYHDNSEP
ncbi:hypothetical protein PCANC_05662 [Puccinia coronata f. sp. avenae]|uniref:Uncharacterized protein n=1 Tax=Puccinia coronata f. sp. avenae TaxID=200324 RepID=A0A2N5U9M2_9BASI|nr:hypothetical protein PCASD_15171 [Puccinia coronata f. sp. avenae]PLW54832.1 hypothetical protein PCANC_05662 [Puccinia coronata f. sp. avenae]